MKKLFIASLALVAALAFASCSGENSEENTTNTADSLAMVAANAAADAEAALKSKVAEFGEGLFGTYKATLPAADASANEATLVINADLTYSLTENYVDKDVIETTGKISDGNFANKTITLTETNGDSKMFRIAEGGNLVMLTPDGTEPTNVAAHTFTRQ